MCRLQLKQKYLQRQAEKSPEIFREQLTISAAHDKRLPHYLHSWQKEDFGAMDAGWMELAQSGMAPAWQPVIRRAYIERPRGHSKTSDMAIQIAWILQNAVQPVVGVAAAADRDQANLILQAVEKLVRLNPVLCGDLQFRKHAIYNVLTGSQLEIISSDVKSSWGILPDFVICDELCHWEKPDLWYSLLSSASKKANCVLVVLTNAGVGRDWQWEVRENAMQSSHWYFSTLEGPQADWITRESLEEQQQMLPPAVYARLWLNQWQHSEGEFVTLAEAEACQNRELQIQETGVGHRQYVAAIDYAEKHDYTVGVVLHQEGEDLVIDRMDVVVPSPERPTPISWVENWIHQMASRFAVTEFVIDEYQLLGTIQKLEQYYPIKRFEFQGGKGNHALAMVLRNLIVQRRLQWYPRCGQLDDRSERDDLETELSSLLLRQTQGGRVRIDHHQRMNFHDDRAFALGAACLYAMRSTGAEGWMEISPPTTDGLFHLN